MKPSFIHLHLHSEYSILDSIVPIKPLISTLKSQCAPAVAVTDICNLFGMVKFYKNAMQAGIKPIIGAECWIENIDNRDLYHKCVFLCQNKEGYYNLSQLISKAYQFGDRLQAPLIKKAWIAEHHAGLIALSGAQWGEVAHALNHDSNKAEEVLKEWMTLFPNRFYLELQRNNRQDEKQHEKAILSLASNFACPIVATNEVVFLHKADFDAHKARVCIQEGVTLDNATWANAYSEEQYLKTPEQMCELFHDLPFAIQNTIEIAKRCTLELVLDQPVLPSFPVPSHMTEESFLAQASNKGLEKRLTFLATLKDISSEIKTQYQERLDIELSVINRMGFPGYFLIVADFIQWAKDQNIPVGPGRGSGAGSLVAYALGITDLDPLEYDLLFERFLNPERVSMPDFDIDFCMDNRDRVIDYVANRYGRANVSQIATFGTMAAKAVLRDVGRVLGHPYGFVDRLAKLIPFEIGMTLEKALEQEVSLKKSYDEEEDVRNLIDLAKKLEGITRNVGKHAGGVVIAPSELTTFAPLFCEKDSDSIVIQFDKDDVETIGLTKFDFLGLRTLTIIDWAVKNANAILAKRNEPLIEIERIPLDDPETFALLCNCATTAVFQLESRGMKELIKRLHPDKFEEIIALVALFRPGPLQSGMVDDFINRKHKRAKVEYLHEDIVPILKPTYGVILYQEQVMQIAQTLAGYTLGAADLLRRAMGKKKPEEMAKQRTFFIEGSINRGVSEKIASTIFDLMEKFAGYGFNKSHSAAYALVSYQTAWLKAHYPSAFMAAVLSADMAHTDKIVIMIEECRHCDITVIPPHINQSDFVFTVNENDEIVYGLGAIKGLGEGAIEQIIEQRAKKPFTDLFDFCNRVDMRKVNKRAITALIKSGTLDCFGTHRAQLISLIDEAVQSALQDSKNLSFGQSDLFQFDMALESPQHKTVPEWTAEELLLGEKESLGMYFSGHPLQAVEPELIKMGVVKFKDIARYKKDQKFFIAGLILALKTVKTKNGERMAILMLDDRHERFEVTLFPEFYQNHRDLLIKDQLIIIHGTAAIDNYSGATKIRGNTCYSLGTAREAFIKQLTLCVNQPDMPLDFIKYMKDCLAIQERGSCPIVIEYNTPDAKVMIKLDEKWNIKPSESVLNTINEQLEINAILEY